SPEEGLVPLVIIAPASYKADFFEKSVTKNKNKNSHYNIFPTLINLMGFSKNPNKEIYDGTLFEPSNDPFSFNSRFYARLGQKPVWNYLDLNKNIGPDGKTYNWKN
ncbi:MAG: sulfatase, partial [Halopseudomonas sp.]